MHVIVHMHTDVTHAYHMYCTRKRTISFVVLSATAVVAHVAVQYENNTSKRYDGHVWLYRACQV